MGIPVVKAILDGGLTSTLLLTLFLSRLQVRFSLTCRLPRRDSVLPNLHGVVYGQPRFSITLNTD